MEVNGENASIIYVNEYATEYNNFELVNYQSVNDQLVMKLKYNGENYNFVRATVNYYNADGNLLKQSSDWMYADAGATNTYIFSLPKTSTGQLLNYSAFTISIGSYPGNVNGLLSVKDNLEIGAPSSISKDYESDTCVRCSATIPVQNKGTAEIQDGEVVVYFWEGETLVDVYTVGLDGIVGSESTNRTALYYWDSEQGKEKHTPDGITIDLNYAYINQ